MVNDRPGKQLRPDRVEIKRRQSQYQYGVSESPFQPNDDGNGHIEKNFDRQGPQGAVDDADADRPEVCRIIVLTQGDLRGNPSGVMKAVDKEIPPRAIRATIAQPRVTNIRPGKSRRNRLMA